MKKIIVSIFTLFLCIAAQSAFAQRTGGGSVSDQPTKQSTMVKQTNSKPTETVKTGVQQKENTKSASSVSDLPVNRVSTVMPVSKVATTSGTQKSSVD